MSGPRNVANAAAIATAALLTISVPLQAENPAPYPGTVMVESSHEFETLVSRLKETIAANDMGLVASASASAGARARGIEIPGNIVLMVFRNDFAVRMLDASIAAGIEAPLRVYVSERPNGPAIVTYRKPSAVFAPYEVDALDAMAAELDPVLERIVMDAATAQ